MNLLLLTPYSPAPPDSGGRMRIWQELKFFSARHSVSLVAFYQTAREEEFQNALREFCERVWLVEKPTRPNARNVQKIQTRADLFDWYTTPEMARRFETLQHENFDAVIIHHIFMAHAAKWFSAPRVLEEHNIESEIFRQHAQAIPRRAPEHTFRQTRWLLLRQYEDEMWKQFTLRVVTSEHDKALMAQRLSGEKICVVENGIAAREIEMLPRSTSRKILFMGSLDFFPNIDALLYFRETILPLLWAREPDLQLVIAGRRPPNAIQEFANDARITVIPNPENMDEIARDCALTIVPMRMGSGTRIKILHAFALGLPVVTTSKGAEGLAIENESHALLQDEPRAFADAILRVLNDAALAQRLRVNGRALVETQYDWEIILPRYEKELRALHHE